ncbi:MAG: hypothetical protein A2Y73_02765 [Chloroflexi bacterium RBG_13_56_8]|nr:MAG: hypothetical protein A2Y73_02765 [Chloroflexi bacterium RBG_13_56_8]
MIDVHPPARRRFLLYLVPVLVFVVAFLLYASTAAPWLTWANYGADGGDLIAAAMTWGVPHPTGYPTYCLLGRLYALLPLGSVARRFNLFSATMGAATIVMVYLMAQAVLRRESNRLIWRDVVIALFVSLACAAGGTFWSQAVIAEVYTLHTFFFALCLYLALRSVPLNRWRGFVLGLVFGLGLGVHLTLVLILPGLMLLLWPRRRDVHLLPLAVGVLVGLSVYAYLPLAARGDPPIAWGDPRTWQSFWWVVSGKLYHPYAFALPLEHFPARLGGWAHGWAQEFTWPGVALALWGVWSWVQGERRAWAVATGLVFAVYVLYAIGYDTADSHVYLLPTYLITALWIAEGSRTVLDELAGLRYSSLWIVLGLCALAVIPLSSVLHNYKALDLSEDRTVVEWVDDALGELPIGALLITGEDRHTFALDYVRWVEGQRQDLLVMDGELFPQPWYAEQIRRRYPSLAQLKGRLSVERVIHAFLGERDVYLTSRRNDLESAYQLSKYGVLWKATAKD